MDMVIVDKSIFYPTIYIKLCILSSVDLSNSLPPCAHSNIHHRTRMKVFNEQKEIQNKIYTGAFT